MHKKGQYNGDVIINSVSATPSVIPQIMNLVNPGFKAMGVMTAWLADTQVLLYPLSVQPKLYARASQLGPSVLLHNLSDNEQ